jgi:hypothetical protein
MRNSAVFRWLARLLMYASSLAGLSCFLTGPSQLAGNYRLVKFGVDAIPVRLFEIPGRDGQSTGCWYTLTEGTLRLTEAPDSFHYELTYRNSCDNTVLFTNVVEGTWIRTGDGLTFVIPAQDTELRFSVESNDDRLVLRPDPSHVYTFVRGT